MFTINISKYLKNKSKVNGQVISSLILDLFNTYKFKDILFVRTCTTGAWLDNLLIDNQDINRILSEINNLNKDIKNNFIIS